MLGYQDTKETGLKGHGRWNRSYYVIAVKPARSLWGREWGTESLPAVIPDGHSAHWSGMERLWFVSPALPRKSILIAPQHT